jgi:hypothetical protein
MIQALSFVWSILLFQSYTFLQFLILICWRRSLIKARKTEISSKSFFGTPIVNLKMIIFMILPEKLVLCSISSSHIISVCDFHLFKEEAFIKNQEKPKFLQNYSLAHRLLNPKVTIFMILLQKVRLCSISASQIFSVRFFIFWRRSLHPMQENLNFFKIISQHTDCSI